MRAHAGRINRLNVYPVPDGDTGTNMARTLDAVVAEMDAADPDDLGADVRCDQPWLADGCPRQQRRDPQPDPARLRLHAEGGDSPTRRSSHGPKFAEALQAAATGAYQAVLKPIEGTILTVARESAEAAQAAADRRGFARRCASVLLARPVSAALENTPELLPVLKDAGVVDAGGAGSCCCSTPRCTSSTAMPLPEPAPTLDDGSGRRRVRRRSPIALAGRGELDVSEQRYEVMYFLDLLDDADRRVQAGGARSVTRSWSSAATASGTVTSTPTTSARRSRSRSISSAGRARSVSPTCSRRSPRSTPSASAAMTAARRATAATGARSRAGGGLPPVTMAVVAVCSGDGLVELFAQLGVQGVVTGGQTMNPSTAELLDTVEHVNAERSRHPARTTRTSSPSPSRSTRSRPRPCVVVPTRSMPEALAALVVYDPEATPPTTRAEMAEAADSVTTGEITQAVRDTNTRSARSSGGRLDRPRSRGDGIVSRG